jgi:hypothetical protein
MSSEFLSRFGTVAVAICLVLGIGRVNAQNSSPIEVSVDPAAAGFAIPDDYLGLSFETAATLPDSHGTYPYFRADNAPLIALFKTIGIKSLRIGGNTSDRPGVKIPGTADIDQLFAFAHAANVKVIYTLRLRESDPQQAAPIAKYLMEHYKSDIECIAIGNEPDVYEKQYAKYHDDIQGFLSVLTAADVAPELKLCGPSTTADRERRWSSNFARDFGPGGRVVWITQHSYPGGNGKIALDVPAERDRLLSPDFAKNSESLYQDFAPAVLATGLSYRIEETNSFYNGGAKDVSNTFTSVLWGLDYLFWWAAHQSQGINFHTGDNVAAGEQQTPCWYATFWTKPQGYEVHPIAYAIKAFDLASHGKLVAVRFATAQPMMSAYGVLRADKSLYITLINKEHESSAHPVEIKLQLPAGYRHAETMSLTAPGNDIGATSEVKLGGSSISGNGAWSGNWARAKTGSHDVSFVLPPASAMIVRLTQGK